MIGIIGAMAVEVDAIKAMLKNKKAEAFGGIEFFRGTINEKDVVVAQCGIGKVFAAMCAEAMILNYKLEYILNVGVAGALSEKLDVASIVISSSLVQHDMDTTPLGDPIGMISGLNIVNIEANRDVISKVEEAVAVAGIKYEIGVIASGDQFINDSKKKEYIKNTFNAIACEMEGAAIAQVAYVNKVPFCVIRAISDKADGSSHVDFSAFTKMAVENSVRVIDALLK